MKKLPLNAEVLQSEEFYDSLVKLVGAASYYRAALRGLIGDPTAVKAADHEEFLVAHAENLDKADGIIRAWTQILGLEEEPDVT